MRKLRASIGPALAVVALTAGVVSAGPLAAIAVPNPGTATSTIIIQNADAANDATWVLDFVDQTGTSVSGAEQSGILPPYVATAVNVGNLSILGTGWNGSGIVSSDRETAAVVQSVWTGGSLGDHTTAAEYAGFSQGYDQLTFPYSFNSNRVSWVTVQNTGSTEESVYFSFVDRRTGLQSGSTTMDTVPAGAQRTYRLNDCSTGIVPTEVCTRPATDNEGDYWKGATVVTSTNPVLAGVATTHWARWTGQYVGVPQPESANELIFPLFFRVRQKAGSFGENKPYHRYSDMNIANPDLAAATTITVSLYHVSGTLSDQWTVDIPAGSSVAVNTRFGGVGAPSNWATRWPNLLVDGQGNPNWLGAAVVTAEPGKEIQGICFNFWPSETQDFVVGYNAVARATGKGRLFFPLSYRASNTTFYTQAQLQNTETTTTTVDIYFFNRGQATGGVGNELHALTGIEIPASASLSLNTRFNSTGFPANWFTGLGTSFQGSVVVVSQGGDIAGVAFNLNTQSGSQRASGYNGVPLD